jgi:hypothetical protein
MTCASEGSNELGLVKWSVRSNANPCEQYNTWNLRSSWSNSVYHVIGREVLELTVECGACPWTWHGRYHTLDFIVGITKVEGRPR